MISFTLICVLLYIAIGFRTLTSSYHSKWWLSIFVTFWGCILLISSFNPLGLNRVQPAIYIIYLIFIFSYCFGFIASPIKNSRINKVNTNILIGYYKKTVSSKMLLSYLIFSIFTLGIYFKKYYEVILITGASEAREARFFVGDVFGSGFEILAFNYLISTFIWFPKFIISFGIAFRCIKNMAWLLSMVAILLFMGFGAGRNIIMELFFMIIFLTAIRNNLQGDKIKQNKLFIILLISTFLFLSIYLTAFRRYSVNDIDSNALISSWQLLAEHSIVYVIGSIRSFQYAFDNYDQHFWLSYGYLTFSGIDELVSYFSTLIGLIAEPYSWRIGAILNIPINIGKDQEFNALYTAVFNFYFDFGLIGVIVFSFGLGFISALILKKFLYQGDFSLLFLSSIFFIISIWTVLSWKLQSAELVIVIVSALLLPKFRFLKLKTPEARCEVLV